MFSYNTSILIFILYVRILHNMNDVLVVNVVFIQWFCHFFFPSQPPTTFAELMSEGGKKVWPVWELFKWFLGFSSHTIAAIGL